MEQFWDMENEFMVWFHVFILDDVIEIGQLVGYFEKQAIPRRNGYFDITVSMHSNSQFRRHFRTSRSPDRNDWKLQVPSSS